MNERMIQASFFVLFKSETLIFRYSNENQRGRKFRNFFSLILTLFNNNLRHCQLITTYFVEQKLLTKSDINDRITTTTTRIVT